MTSIQIVGFGLASLTGIVHLQQRTSIIVHGEVQAIFGQYVGPFIPGPYPGSRDNVTRPWVWSFVWKKSNSLSRGSRDRCRLLAHPPSTLDQVV